jgi:hypothetical protein
MKKTVATLLLSLVLSAVLGADDHPAVEFKNKSSFQMDSGGRNPFWPIGYKPTAQLSNAAGHSAFNVPLSAFVLTSITLEQGNRFAIINGKTMQEGQQFAIQIGSQSYPLKVKSIEDGQVVLSLQDRDIVVPLRRK